MLLQILSRSLTTRNTGDSSEKGKASHAWLQGGDRGKKPVETACGHGRCCSLPGPLFAPSTFPMHVLHMQQHARVSFFLVRGKVGWRADEACNAPSTHDARRPARSNVSTTNRQVTSLSAIRQNQIRARCRGSLGELGHRSVKIAARASSAHTHTRLMCHGPLQMALNAVAWKAILIQTRNCLKKERKVPLCCGRGRSFCN